MKILLIIVVVLDVALIFYSIYYYLNKRKQYQEDIKYLENNIQSRNEKINQLEEKINRKQNNFESEKIRVSQLNDYIDELKRDINEKFKELKQQEIIIETKNNLMINLEKKRRESAGKVGGLQKEINKLKEELNIANKKIEFLKTHRKAPSMEELKAYECSYREVLKRQKDKQWKKF